MIMKFVMNGLEWKILEIAQEDIKLLQNKRAGNGEKEDEKELKNRYYGISYCDDCIVYLDKDLPEQRKRKTLLHELAHCYIADYITHCEKSYDEEMVADIVANSHDIIKAIADKYFSEARDE